jgi:hypothetical protein
VKFPAETDDIYMRRDGGRGMRDGGKEKEGRIK